MSSESILILTNNIQFFMLLIFLYLYISSINQHKKISKCYRNIKYLSKCCLCLINYTYYGTEDYSWDEFCYFIHNDPYKITGEKRCYYCHKECEIYEIQDNK